MVLKSNLKPQWYGNILLLLLLFTALNRCSEHPFNNPADPLNQGIGDEFQLMFQSPVDNAGALTWDGVFLWIAAGNGNEVYLVDSTNGALYDSMRLPVHSISGMDYVQGSLWVSDAANRRIYEIDSLSGSVLFSFGSPGTAPKGIHYDTQRNVLYNVDANALQLYTLDPDTGAVIETLPGISTSGPEGMTMVGENTILVAAFPENSILLIDRDSHELIRSFEGPDLAPLGLTWDGEWLWVSDWDSMIYRVRME